MSTRPKSKAAADKDADAPASEPLAPAELEPPQAEPGQGQQVPGDDEDDEPQPSPEHPATVSPLIPAVPRPREVAPQPGDSAAAPGAVARTAPGPHMYLCDDNDDLVDPDEVFVPQRGPSTLAVVAKRVYQVFRYPGTSTPVRQLLFSAGTQVPLARAHQVIAEIKAVAAESARRTGPEQAAL